MQPGVIDLGELKQRADERDKALEAVAEQQEAEAAVERVAAWDKAMRRTFKGILPRNEAYRFLMRVPEDV